MNRTDFVAAVQCRAKGWRQARTCPEPDPDTAFEIEQHREVQLLARTLFPNARHDATFRAAGYIAAVPILRRHRQGWNAIEVTSSFSANREHLDNLAYSVMVLRRAGLTASPIWSSR